MNPTYVKILKEVIKYGPLIAEAGKKIYDNTKDMFGRKSQQKGTTTSLTVQELDKKIAQLEQNDLEQAKLISDMAQQNENLSILANALAKRFWIAMIIASFSIILSLLLLIIK